MIYKDYSKWLYNFGYNGEFFGGTDVHLYPSKIKFCITILSCNHVMKLRLEVTCSMEVTGCNGGGANVTEMWGGPITTPKHPDKQIYP